MRSTDLLIRLSELNEKINDCMHIAVALSKHASQCGLCETGQECEDSSIFHSRMMQSRLALLTYVHENFTRTSL